MKTKGNAEGRFDLRRRKIDPLAAGKIEFVDYKDLTVLRKFLNESGKILPARITGLSRANQRMVTKAIKRARAIGFLPYSGHAAN